MQQAKNGIIQQWLHPMVTTSKFLRVCFVPERGSPHGRLPFIHSLLFWFQVRTGLLSCHTELKEGTSRLHLTLLV